MFRACSRFRQITAAIVLAVLAACAPKPDLNKPPVPLGRFLLGLNIVVTNAMQKSPVSREATGDEWQAAIKDAVKARFGRYDGDKYYDVSVNVLGYALAPPGIPIILAPKSILIFEVRLWEDATQHQLNVKPKLFTVFEGTSGATIIGSGYSRTKEEQMKLLSYNAAKAIEGWMVAHPEWFPADGNIAPVGPDGEVPPLKPAAAATAPAPATTAAPAPIAATPLPAPVK